MECWQSRQHCSRVEGSPVGSGLAWHYKFGHNKAQYLHLLESDLPLHPLHRCIHQILLPLLIPDGVEVQAGRVGDSFKGGRARGFIRASHTRFLTGRTFPELIGNAPAGDREQETSERAGLRLGFKVRHAPGHGNDRLLHGVLRLGIGETRLRRNAVDQPPIEIKEFAPTLLVPRSFNRFNRLQRVGISSSGFSTIGRTVRVVHSNSTRWAASASFNFLHFKHSQLAG